jgi:hypothetical protein
MSVGSDQFVQSFREVKVVHVCAMTAYGLVQV